MVGVIGNRESCAYSLEKAMVLWAWATESSFSAEPRGFQGGRTKRAFKTVSRTGMCKLSFPEKVTSWLIGVTERKRTRVSLLLSVREDIAGSYPREGENLSKKLCEGKQRPSNSTLRKKTRLCGGGEDVERTLTRSRMCPPWHEKRKVNRAADK